MRFKPTSLLVYSMLFLLAQAAWAEDWPQWRGPSGDGTSRETGLPVQWSETEGVAWKCAIPEWGNSTPAIWGPAIFLTAHAEDDRLLLVKIDADSGRIAWTREVGHGTAERLPRGYKKTEDDRGRPIYHPTQNQASPSPATDGEVVTVHFGNGDLAAYDFSGSQLWRRNLQDDHGRYTIWWGHANSPLLWGDLVISVCMQDSLVDLGKPASPSYVVAHDKRTGQQRWKTMRMTAALQEDCDSYTTPLLWPNQGRDEIVIMGGRVLDAYAPATGQRLWELPDLEGSRVITGPVAADGLIYFTQGKRDKLLAVRPGGPGKRPPSDILWTLDDGTPDSPTPVVSRGLLFLVSDQGIAKCLDARRGELRWQERLKGQYRASPLAAEGRIYFLNNKGLAIVIAAAAEFKVLAENQLDDVTFASPAAAGGKLYIRGNKSLYCLEATVKGKGP